MTDSKIQNPTHPFSEKGPTTALVVGHCAQSQPSIVSLANRDVLVFPNGSIIQCEHHGEKIRSFAVHGVIVELPVDIDAQERRAVTSRVTTQ